MPDPKFAARVLLAAILLAGAAMLLGGCNTVRGAAEDIESGADAVDEATTGDVG